jgi:hypothetical protein
MNDVVAVRWKHHPYYFEMLKNSINKPVPGSVDDCAKYLRQEIPFAVRTDAINDNDTSAATPSFNIFSIITTRRKSQS